MYACVCILCFTSPFIVVLKGTCWCIQEYMSGTLTHIPLHTHNPPPHHTTTTYTGQPMGALPHRRSKLCSTPNPPHGGHDHCSGTRGVPGNCHQSSTGPPTRAVYTHGTRVGFVSGRDMFWYGGGGGGFGVWMWLGWGCQGCGCIVYCGVSVVCVLCVVYCMCIICVAQNHPHTLSLSHTHHDPLTHPPTHRNI